VKIVLFFNVTVYILIIISCNLIDILIYVIYADVIGVMTGVGVEREYEREGVKTKMNVIELDSNG